MITQEQFVTACHKYYTRNNLEPGNPKHGEWHKAHYPYPRCLGGTEWVWLLKRHHAIQGVIQSEELGHRCIYRWELKYLPKYYLQFGHKWTKVRSPRNPNNPKRRRAETSDWHRLTWPLLLEELQEKLEANPYPGQHWRLFALAQRLMPEVSKREWCELFFWFGISNTMVHTPVEVVELDIIAVEQELLALLAEGQTLLPSSLEGVLRCSPGSRQYRVAKRGLEERGWRWARRRQPPTTIMVPPPSPRLP
jgi:hypothetical protein